MAVPFFVKRLTEKLDGGLQVGRLDSSHYRGSWEWVDNNNPEVYLAIANLHKRTTCVF